MLLLPRKRRIERKRIDSRKINSFGPRVFNNLRPNPADNNNTTNYSLFDEGSEAGSEREYNSSDDEDGNNSTREIIPKKRKRTYSKRKNKKKKMVVVRGAKKLKERITTAAEGEEEEEEEAEAEAEYKENLRTPSSSNVPKIDGLKEHGGSGADNDNDEEETISVAGSLSDFEDDFELFPGLDGSCPVCEYSESYTIMPSEMKIIRGLIAKGKRTGNLKKAIKQALAHYNFYLKTAVGANWDEDCIKNHFLNHMGGDNEYQCKKNVATLSLIQKSIIKNDLMRKRNDGPVDSFGVPTMRNHMQLPPAKFLLTLIEKNINLRLKVENQFGKQPGRNKGKRTGRLY